MSIIKTQNQDMFKDLSIEHFWYPFVATIFDNMNFAFIIGAGDKMKIRKILTFLAELLWPMYKSTFESKNKFIECVNCTTLGILDSADRRFKLETIKEVFYVVKMNWNKNHKYITSIK